MISSHHCILSHLSSCSLESANMILIRYQLHDKVHRSGTHHTQTHGWDCENFPHHRALPSNMESTSGLYSNKHAIHKLGLGFTKMFNPTRSLTVILSSCCMTQTYIDVIPLKPDCCVIPHSLTVVRCSISPVPDRNAVHKITQL